MQKLILLISFIFINKAIGQHQGFTESYPINKLGINPALAGSDPKMRFSAIGQYGKANELGSLKNYYVSLEVPILKSIGTSIQYSDYSNLLVKYNTLAVGFAKHFQINDKTSLSFGLNGGTSNVKYDYKSDYGLSYLQELNDKTVVKNPDKGSLLPSGSFGQNSVNQFAENQYLLGAGVFLNADKWHIGFAIPNLVKNKLPDNQDPAIKYVVERPAFLSLERDFDLTKKISLKSGTLYRFTKNEYSKGLDLQTSVWLNKKYSLGIWYQRIGAKSIDQNKPLLGVAEIIVSKARLAYSFNLSKNSNNFTNIKQQVMLRLDIDYLKKKQKI
jgi:type IX secretion system PorP/SprF family membrane protein